MFRHWKIAFVVTAVACVFVPAAGDGPVLAAPLGGQQDEVSLIMSNPSRHPNLGLPNFLVAGNDAALTSASVTVADVLWSDLDFEREFYMIPRPRSASIPVAAADALPFEQWSNLGADVVLVGSTSRGGNNLTIELRAIAVRGADQGRQVFGAQYTCRIDNPRFCAHSIADDFHKQVRGLDGVAKTKIAFVSTRDATRVTGRPVQSPGQGKEIYLADYDGENETRFTVNRNLNITPAWSPDGALLAYVSYTGGAMDIYVANLQQPGRLRRPAGGNLNVQNWLPAWSPDGSKLAFVSSRGGNSDIWVVNQDGSGLANLTPGSPTIDSAPTWSPDGSKIAFTSDRAGPSQLYVMSSSGTGVDRLISDRVDRPTWSTLNFIAFTIGGGPGHDIAIYDFNNPGVRILTDGIGSNESPAVAPNGRHIVFVTTRWGLPHLAVIDRAGERLKRLTETGENTFPNWQPAVRR
jgi:TolB protein